MLRSVLLKTLRDGRRGLIGWSLGIVGITLMYAAFYPSIVDSADVLNEYLDRLPEALRGFIGEGVDFTTPEGYVQTEMFSIFVPLFLLVYAIGAGARATAGEEESLTLDLLLSTPIPRSRVLWEKLGAMVVGSALLGFALWASIAVLGPLWDLRIELGPLAAACLMLVLLGIAHGCISLLVGAATGSRALAIGIPSALAAVAYIVNALAPSVEVLDRIRGASPFYWAIGTRPITEGLPLGGVVVLIGIAAAAFALAQVAFARRDLAS